jgi:uncharacterized protein (DUF3084 family)
MFTQIPLWVYLVVVLVPVSGFIAWAGDKIGHKVGKRRQSLFGLRPRHTATLFTIGAGVGISVVSFLVVWLSSAELRTVLSEGHRLVATNERLKAENDRLAADIAAMRRTIAQAQGEAQDAIQARDAALKANREVKAESERARKGLVAARTELAAAKGAFGAAQKRVEAARSEIADARTKLGDTRSRLAAVQGTLADAQSRLRLAQSRYDEATRQVALAEKGRQAALALEREARRQARDAQTEADGVTRTAKMVIDEQNRQLALQKQEYARETEGQRTQLASLSDEVRDLETKRDRLIEMLGQSRMASTALRQSPITYRVGEEVDRLPIPAGISIWRVQNSLDALLDAAAKKAQARGAAPPPVASAGPVPTPRAVVIPPLLLDKPAGSGETVKGGGDPAEPTVVTEGDALRAAADAIRRKNEEVVVVLTAAANAVAGEPVPVVLHTYRNPVVLRAGEKVGELTLEGVESREQAADTLYAFLRRDVRKRLLDAGIIPPAAGGGAENDGDGDDGIIVSLSGTEWLSVMDSIRRAGPRSRVVVKAARDLRAADPVRLSFEVKSLPVPPGSASPADAPAQRPTAGPGSVAGPP